MENHPSEDNDMCERTKKIKRETEAVTGEIYRRLHAHNRQVTRDIYRIVRRQNPHLVLLNLVLTRIVGDLAMKKNVIEPLIAQATRFKMYDVLHVFIQYITDLDDSEKEYRSVGKCMQCVELSIPLLPLCGCVGRKAG